MDEQNDMPQADQNNTKPVINDITPPPVAIAVQVDSSDSGDDSSLREVGEEPKEQEAEDKAMVNDEQDLAPVAAPPEDEEVVEESASDGTADEKVAPLEETSAPKEEEQPVEQVEESPMIPIPQYDATEPTQVGIAASQMIKPPHRNNKKMAVIVTILVALVLAGVAVFVYLSANKNTSKTLGSTNQQVVTPSSETSEQAADPETPATTQDIDTASADIETAVSSLNETADFVEKDLTDATLGL